MLIDMVQYLIVEWCCDQMYHENCVTFCISISSVLQYVDIENNHVLFVHLLPFKIWTRFTL